MEFIDTHSHVYGEEFDTDRSESVERAKEKGVCRIILPDIDAASRPKMLEVSATFPELMRPLIGVHPTSVNGDVMKELKEVERHLGKMKFYGIGECGLDFYWNTTYCKEQLKAFEYQLNIAKDAQLPVIIHSRESLQEIFKTLNKFPDVKGILHCFPGNTEDAKQACDRGYLLGIGGVVTFKNSHLADVVRQTDLKNIVLETDAPYLAPVPYRGKRNESAYLPIIAQKIAEIKDMDVKKIAEITTQNAMKLFSLQ